MSDTDRLKALQSDYRANRAKYRDNHPDVIRLEREIRVLEEDLGVGPNPEYLQKQLREQQQLLAELKTRYNESHQEVQSTMRVIEQLERDARKAESAPRNVAESVADNPAYVLLQTQVDTLDSEMASLSGREKNLQDQLDEYERLLERAPLVEMEYKALQREHDNATAEYRDIKTKQRGATTAQNLEKEQKGERFALIEPAGYPQDPVSPNRPAIMFLGFVLALGVGVGLALVRELTDRAIHGVNQFTALLGQEPLVVIPYIENDVDVLNRRRAWAFLALGTAIVLLLIVYLNFIYL